MAMVFLQCLPFSWMTLKSKHCRHPIAVMGIVDTFGTDVTTLLLLFFIINVSSIFAPYPIKDGDVIYG
jgi:hypothetical protein